MNNLVITSIYINIGNCKYKLKAFVTIILNDCIAINDLKIIDINGKLTIVYPQSRNTKNGYTTVAPINPYINQYIQEQILAKYQSLKKNNFIKGE